MSARTRRGTVAGLVAGAAASLVVAGTASAASPILVPAASARLAAKPLTLRVQAAPGAPVRASLNGAAIGHQLGPSRHGVRSLVASPNHGLRFGTNVLRVRIGHGRAATVRFTVAADRPLAAAGPDRTIAQGYSAVLDAGRSLLHGGSRRPVAFAGRMATTAATTAPRYRWRIVDAPPGSRVSGVLRDPSARRALLHADVAGTYTARLTVTAPDGRLGVDEVQVRADPAPVVRLDTSATRGGKVGVELNGPGITGDAFYPGDPAKWVQVVVLDRETLEEVSNTSYDCPQAAIPSADPARDYAPCVDRLRSAVASLDAKDLVVAVSQHGAPAGSPSASGLQPALQRIGAVRASWMGTGSWRHGTFAVVGFPGQERALEAVAPRADAVDGARIQVSLMRNGEGEYGPAPTSQDIDTQAAGSDDRTSVIEIAGRRFTEPVTSLGGFHVLSLDPDTLQGESHFYAFFAGTAGHTLDDMAELLHQANGASSAPFAKRRLIVIAQRGLGNLTALTGHLPRLTDEVERAGGTRGAFMRAALGYSGGDQYTLVGHAGGTGGQGQQAIGTLPGGTSRYAERLNPRPLRGTIARTGPWNTYELSSPVVAEGAEAQRAGDGATELTRLAVAPPTAWPEAGNPGRTAAVRWLGLEVLGTDDPRSQYWTNYDEGTWTDVAAAIGARPFAAGNGFDAGDLTWAKDELQQEIRWLKTTHRYVDRLASPFGRSQLTGWAAAQEIAARVDHLVQASPAKLVKGGFSAVFDFARGIGGAIPGVDHVVHAFDAVYELAFTVEEMSAIESPERESFSVKASEYAAELAKHLGETQDYLTRRLPQAIASDYQRLRTIGTCGSLLADDFRRCPTPHELWEYTAADQDRAGRALTDGIRTAALSALLPARFDLYQLPDFTRHVANAGYAGVSYFTCHAPFASSPYSSQYAKPLGLDPDAADGTPSRVYVLGSVTGAGIVGDPLRMQTPEAAVTDPILWNGPGDLGVDRETFFDRAYVNATALQHFPERDTPVGWRWDCGA